MRGNVSYVGRAVPEPGARLVATLFAGATFASACLVFLVQPMVGKLILPLLGGGSAVWNASLAFFQAALLAGYAYAHLLQRMAGTLRAQALVHVAVLASAALVLPLRLSTLVGQPPPSAMPVGWLLAVLALSVGLPFAALSATAPMLQAWFARLGLGRTAGENPYVLYVASNLGSLLALIGYPLLIEPFFTLSGQRAMWSAGYGLFAAVACVLAIFTARGGAASVAEPVAPSPRIGWRRRLAWMGLAAVPSSLMLGVTSHVTTDVASAPFLWVAPLALYLLTFVIAFQARPAVGRAPALFLQAAAAVVCAFILPLQIGGWPLQLGVHLTAFFLTALVCHQTLAALRPSPARLTDFYLMMSLGGVLGGAFNAFVAPVIFEQVWEYPLALALAGLARPWGVGRPRRLELVLVACGLAAAAAAPLLAYDSARALGAMALVGACAFLLRGRAPAFSILLAALLAAGSLATSRFDTLDIRRSFFGTHKVIEAGPPDARMRLLFNGTTIHGGQWTAPEWACEPVTYYAAPGPLAGALRAVQARKPSVRIGVVGLGAGSLAAYVRPGDRLRYFEIDPEVLSIARDSGAFSFLTRCAQGSVDYRLGDARLTLTREADGAFDILLIDAFSSDSIPTHLLTVEAMTAYMRKLAPDGVLVLHLTNRNLDLMAPAAATARAAGLVAAEQRYVPAPGQGAHPVASVTSAMVLARNEAALRKAAPADAWRPAELGRTRAWTDDYVNVLGALVARARGR